jgi:surface antigen
MSPREAFLASPLAVRPTGGDETESATKVRLISVFLNTAGQICRVYEGSIRIDGHREIAEGTICRKSDGSWSVSP